jgi:putative flippase GtrA
LAQRREIDPATPVEASGFWSRLVRLPLLRQFIKFCLVGATSTTVDLGLFTLLRNAGLPRLAAQTCSFSLAVTNGFFWNRRWTFRAGDSGRLHRQYLSFYAVNIVGFLLNTSILYLVATLLENQGVPERRAELAGKLIAVPIVAFWNFTASKFWAFGSKPGPDA